MDMETGYGIQKLHPIHVKTPDLLSLRQWGRCLKGNGTKPSRGVAKLLRISASEVRREKRNRNGLEGIPKASLEDRLGQLQQMDS
ncbi:hypothetical protein CR513_24847, partial [Mucuna pruriens]